MKKINPEALLAAGVHFGHKKWRIHPKSRPFIYKMERDASIIDLFKTVEKLEKARQFVYQLGVDKKTLLVVGTKKQARQVLYELCQKHNLFYIVNKWIGGFITNFEEISKNIGKMRSMQKERDEGTWETLPKHEMTNLEKELAKLERIYKGVQTMEKLPDALFIVDVCKEHTVVAEAIRRAIPMVAIIDTNADPSKVEYPIPGNDDSVSSITILTEAIIDAYVEGREKTQRNRI